MTEISPDTELDGITPPTEADIPAELWMLWNGGGWVCAVDDPRGGENYLVATSEADAIAASKHQAKAYHVDNVPIRVK